MSKTVTNLLLMFITIVAATYFYIQYCSSCNKVQEGPPKAAHTAPSVPQPTSYNFVIVDDGFSYMNNDNYNFNHSSSSILMPLNSGVGAGIDSLGNYLEKNNGKAITITGYYTSDEENKTAYPNLGLARANAVKNHFVANGILSSKINTKGKLMDEMVADEGVFLGPMAYALEVIAENELEELRALHDDIVANPLVLYFNTAETTINLSAEQRQKVAEISRYLDKVENASVTIEGHTDNTGNAKTNIKLGLERAEFAKSYLMSNGISENRITVTSKGQTEPIASNATEEGRAKNRRTIVTLN